MFVHYDSIAMADGGSYISTDTTAGGSYSTGGYGGAPSKASWFFYSYQGNNEGESVKFLPIAFDVGDINRAVTINGACAKKGGGFWHFGRTDGSVGTLDCNFRNDGKICSGLGWNYYNMSPGSYYHSQTINRSSWNSYWKYSSPAASNIRHEIYNNGQLKYKATKSSGDPWESSNSEVAKAWKQACSAAGRSDCNAVPDDVSYFCWWPGLQNEIQGRATAGQIRNDASINSGNEPSTIGYVDTGYTQTTMTQKIYKIQDCPITGCYAKLGLYLNWKSGNGTAEYYFRAYRNGAWTNWESKKDKKPNSGTSLKVKGLYGDVINNEGKQYRWGIEKLYPGQSVCYQMEFYAQGSTSGEPIYVTSCVVATSNSTTETKLDVKVSNETVDKYRSFQETVYAKPGDIVKFRATYEPNPQYAYSLIAPQSVKMDCDKSSTGPYLFYNGSLSALFKERCGYTYESGGINKEAAWNSAFSIQRKESSTDFSKNSTTVIPFATFDLGSTKKVTKDYALNSTSSVVQTNQVGISINDRAVTNLNNGAKITPSSIRTVYNGGDFVENIYYIQLASSSNATIDVDSGGKYYSNKNPAPKRQPVVLWSLYGAMNQQWMIQKNKNGTYTFTSMNSGKALNVPNRDTNNGTQLQIWSQNYSCAQQWNIIDHRDGTYSFISTCGNQNKALDSPYASTANGVRLQLYDYHGGAAQRWRLVPVNNSYNSIAEIKTEQVVSNVASVKIPYNFKTAIGVASTGSRTLYAGETGSTSFNVALTPKTNSLTSPNKAYITSAKYTTKLRLRIVSSDPNYNGKVYYVWSNLNSNGRPNFEKTCSVGIHEMYGSKPCKASSIGFNVPDIPAGSKIYIAAMVFPKDSAQDDQMNNNPEGWYDINNDNNWSSSGEVEFIVAKKPSLQVWGGNIYSSGNINVATAVSEKKSLDGYYNYGGNFIADTSKAIGPTTVFGPWGELGIIASGQIKGLASGASIGYTKNENGALVANPGGNTSTGYCVRSPLSFANDECNTYTGQINIASTISTTSNVINGDKDSVLNKFGFRKSGSPVIESSTINLNDLSKINDSNIYYYYGTGSYKVNGGTANLSTIQVLHSNQDITILGDLTYEDADYSLLENSSTNGIFIPKIIIMAKNVNIQCNVNRIDALIIADNEVKTCSNSTNINAEANSNQLKINGAVIAAKLIANRTYGAATGANSIIPAEIINFDPSLYLWGNLGSSGDDNDDDDNSNGNGSGSGRTNLDVTYQRELAPRY